MKQNDFLAQLDSARVASAIEAAEKRTSGEIRVHIQPKSLGNARGTAERTFERLGMTKTDLRNGVLLFIASEEQQFVILGDTGINEKVPADFWDGITAHLSARFKEGRFTEGVVDTIQQAGEALAGFFPLATDDRDELSNEISVDE